MRIKNLIFCLSLALNLTCSSVARANDQAAKAPLFNNLGSFHHEISTQNPLTQRFFDQGLVLFYGFEWGEAIRSFKEATRLDPHCGMCYWGLALALGSKMNAPMTGHEYAEAQSAIRQALALKAYETPEEQAYIQALALRFKHKPRYFNKVGIFSCHTASRQQDESTPGEIKAYAKAMKKVVEKYPQDNDAKTLYAYALFNQIHWRFWDVNNKINPLTPTLMNILQSILVKNPLDIGANHYYIHVMELSPSPEPEKALASSERLRTLVPGSEHLVHMPTHIYFITGRYHQGTESNLQGIEAFKQYNKDCYAQGFEPEINYLYFHNYDYLRTTATMEGRKALALSAARQLVAQPFSTWLANEPTLQWFIPIPYVVEERFGLWNELLAEPMPKTNYQYALGMWHYVRGMALVRTHVMPAAEKELLALQKIVKKGAVEDSLGQQGHKILKIAQEILMATIADGKGNEKSTLAHLKLAAKMQHDMGYHEPPDWYFPVKEILADAYLKWNHPKEAIAMYKLDLKQYPKNAWALYGLAQALRKAGKASEAAQAEQEFKEAWKYADIPEPTKFFNVL